MATFDLVVPLYDYSQDAVTAGDTRSRVATSSVAYVSAAPHLSGDTDSSVVSWAKETYLRTSADRVGGIEGEASSYKPNAITFLSNGSLNTVYVISSLPLSLFTCLSIYLSNLCNHLCRGVASSLSVAVDSALSRVDFSRAIVCCSASAAAYVSSNGGGGGNTAYRPRTPPGGASFSNWTLQTSNTSLLPGAGDDNISNTAENMSAINVSNKSSVYRRGLQQQQQQLAASSIGNRGGGVCPSGVARFCLTAPNAAVTVALPGISIAEGDGGESFCVGSQNNRRLRCVSVLLISLELTTSCSFTSAGKCGAVWRHICPNRRGMGPNGFRRDMLCLQLQLCATRR